MISYLITLNPRIVVWRILKILRLNRLILFVSRRKLIIPFNKVYHRNEFKFEVNSPYINETVEKKGDYFIYTIGGVSKKIDHTKSKLDPNNYIFDYLIWYRNWLLDIKEDICLYEPLIFQERGIATYPHPISNTLINYILIYERLIDNFDQNRVNKFLIDNYNKLVINTEEYTGGNHLIDNYIGLLSLSHFFGFYEKSKFWQIKLDRIISQFGIPEDNVSYARLILWKVDALNKRLGKIDILNNLRNSILLSYPFIEDSLLPMYNDNYIPILQRKFSHLEINTSRYYYLSSRNGLLVFFLKNGLSTKGNHGHDHDSSLSLQVWLKNKCLIGPMGTSHYSNDRARDDLRKRGGGSRFFPNSEHMRFFNSFRVLPESSPIVKPFTNYEIISLGSDRLEFVYSHVNNGISLSFQLNRDQNHFMFYSDEEWIYNNAKNICFCNDLQISGVHSVTFSDSTRFNGLYNELRASRVEMVFGSKIEILIKNNKKDDISNF